MLATILAAIFIVMTMASFISYVVFINHSKNVQKRSGKFDDAEKTVFLILDVALLVMTFGFGFLSYVFLAV